MARHQTIDGTFLTFEEYQKIARRALAKWANQCFCSDEDAVAFVVDKLAWADKKYNPQIGTRDGYRIAQARFAAMNWLNKVARKKKQAIFSLDFIVDNNDGKEITFGETIPSSKLDISDICQYNEIVEVARQKLTSRQLACFGRYYLQGMTVSAIGSELGITKQAVSLNIQRSIRTLKEIFNED